MARPTKSNPTWAQKKSKLNDKTLQKLRTAFSMDCTIEEACLYAKITFQIFYVWKKENPKLFEELEGLRWTPVLKARSEVMKGLKWYTPSMDYLKRKRKDEFSERTEHKVEGEVQLDESSRKAVEHLLELRKNA